MIPRSISELFPAKVRARGERYFAEGRAELTREADGSISAVVKGSQLYFARLRVDDEALSVWCSCPFAQDNGFCKHLWACLRVADTKGMLRPLAEATRAQFIFDDSLGDDEAYADDVSLGEDVNLWNTSDDDPELKPRPAALEQRGVHPPAHRDGAAEGRNAQPLPAWRRIIDAASQRAAYERPLPAPAVWPADRRLVYLIDVAVSRRTPDGIAIELATEKLRRDGTWDPPKFFRLGVDVWMANPDPLDRQIAQMLRGANPGSMWGGAGLREATSFVVTPAAFDTTLRLMCESGRCRLRVDGAHGIVDSPRALHWDSGNPWHVRLRIERATEADVLTFAADLVRDGQEMPVTETSLLHPSGLVIARDTIGRFGYDGSPALITELRASGPVSVSASDLPSLLARLYAMPQVPSIDLPAGVNITSVSPIPTPVLHVTTRDQPWLSQYQLRLELDYDGIVVDPSRTGARVFDERSLRVIQRDNQAETRAHDRLLELGARHEYHWMGHAPALVLAPSRFDKAVVTLASEGWRIVADGVAFRTATEVRASVRSGVDWFDLEGAVSFGGVEAPIPAVLEALKHGRMLVLADGTRGIVSEQLRKRLAPLAAAADLAGGIGRFRKSQTIVLDALLATLPAVEVDERFARARTELRAFERVEPGTAPKTFTGTLRPYQREGLGWLEFLRRFGLGGCLADDMGLGKTVQVLALLESRRMQGAGPSLVVLPKSLVFNWREEAARFAPRLRVLDHTGAQREKAELTLKGVDLVLTTYGTLRHDAPQLREIEFDYVILDEAQAIKNATTASAKAARLLRGHHRLALTGTPIENRLEELWSLFEFLNPGMLGAAAAFKRLAKGKRPSDADVTERSNPGRELIARALRPVILRRTKEQVAPELPAKVEQTLMVELEGPQRRLYDELLEHYRQALLSRVDRLGMARSKIQVLEALLRLRQAACHPALIDKQEKDAPSAKLDVLVPKLIEAAAEGHKALVFSQFTSFLALLRARLDAESISYEYLDGSTNDRQAVVSRFQNESRSSVFLISLKAGGHGLNLTAADYVFLLDPWWNPAVEAQAIDRAHRIGQTRHVLATRLVAHDTVEEKILELQQSKRDLADAILNEDQGLLAKIGREELAMLLSS